MVRYEFAEIIEENINNISIEYGIGYHDDQGEKLIDK